MIRASKHLTKIVQEKEICGEISYLRRKEFEDVRKEFGRQLAENPGLYPPRHHRPGPAAAAARVVVRSFAGIIFSSSS